MLKNARSYNSTTTHSDHNMVVMNLQLELSRLQKPKFDKPFQINTANFRKKDLQKAYQQKVEELHVKNDIKNNDDKWQRVVTSCKQSGEEIIGSKDRKTTSEDIEMKRLSIMRKDLRNQIIYSKTRQKRANLRTQSKYIKKEMNKRLKKKEEQELDEKMKHLESLKDDNTKYHYVLREINKPKHKTSILVKDSEGNVPGSTAEQIKVIEEYFKKTLASPGKHERRVPRLPTLRYENTVHRRRNMIHLQAPR